MGGGRALVAGRHLFEVEDVDTHGKNEDNEKTRKRAHEESVALGGLEHKLFGRSCAFANNPLMENTLPYGLAGYRVSRYNSALCGAIKSTCNTFAATLGAASALSE